MKDFYTRNEYTILENDYLNKIIYKTDEDFEGDEFEIQINYVNEIIIYANNERAKRYALRQLKTFIRGNEILICTFHEKPSFLTRGIIEGFYGRPYTKKQRLDIIDFSDQTRLNAYLYAPKDDLYHRYEWKKPYPASNLEEIKELIDYAKTHCVDFYYCISPGNDFDYSSEEDYKLLFQKIKQIVDLGVNHYALLMDDIPLKLNEVQTEEFKTVGTAHAHLCNKMYDYLASEVKTFEMLMCPTDYIQLGETPYRTDLMKLMKKEIGVFWTGYNTVAEKIDERQSKRINKVLGNNLYLWENYPVNDFGCKERIYLGPITNRSVNLSKYHKGYICNPSWLWNLSKIPLHTMASYAYDSHRYYEVDALKEAIEELIDPEYWYDFEQLAWFNHSGVIEDNYYDIIMKKCFSEKDFTSLDKIYKEMNRISKRLKNYPEEELRQELLPILDYMETEVKLYKSIKANKVNKSLIKKMLASQAKTSNQEILKFIKDNKLVDFEIDLYQKRMNYWRYLDEHKL